MCLAVGRRGLRRQFGPETLVQLALIALGKSSGFTLQEISLMIGKDGKPNLPCADLHKKADELDRQISQLTAMRKTLRHIANCPAPSIWNARRLEDSCKPLDVEAMSTSS
jgi:DNA-binding transcriptional MerR regulator